MVGPRARVNLSTALAYAPYGLIWTFLPIHLRSLNASFLLISLIYFVPSLLPPVWGVLLDRIRKGKEIILVSTLAQAVGFTCLPFLSTPVQYVSVVVVMGFFSASFVPVYASLATWASQRYGRAIGGFWAFASLGFGIATITGGLLYELYGTTPLFELGALFGYAGVATVLFTSKETFYSPAFNVLMDSQGIGRLLRNRRIAGLCLLSALVIFATSAFNVFFTVYLVNVLRGSKLMAGLAATGTTSLGALAYRLVGPLNDNLGRKPVFLAGALGYVAYFIAIYFIKNIFVVALLWIIPIYPLIQSSAAALVSDYTSTGDRGKGLGLLEAAISIGGGIGPLAGGLIADVSGTLDSVVIFSLAVALVSVPLSRILIRDRPVVPPVQTRA
ncbi:MFS transporter [Candidatus Bathyarchaeota archaeon]|nr:MAG: MFS transporter [Candidatus Bathyarchaeota archaeon]